MAPFTVTQRKRARRLAKSLLKEVGIPASLKGYAPLAECIAIVSEYPEKIENFCALSAQAYKTLNMGFNYDSAYHCFDRCISTCFKRCSQEKLIEHFGCTLNPETGSLTAREFVATAGVIVHDKTLRMREEY